MLSVLQLGKETTIQALGKTWTIGRLELRVVREFRDWLKDRLVDPLAIGEQYFRLLPPEEQLARVKEAEAIGRDLKGFSLQCDLARKALATEEGAAKLVQLLLQAHHPDVTMDEAFLVCQEAGPQLERAMASASGSLPNAETPARA